MDEEWLREFIASQRWTFAKTMPMTPHWYVLRRNVADQALFDRVVLDIRQHGFDIKYHGTKYRIYEVDGYKYWTMGFPVHNITGLYGRMCPSGGQPGNGLLCQQNNCTFVLNRAIYPDQGAVVTDDWVAGSGPPVLPGRGPTPHTEPTPLPPTGQALPPDDGRATRFGAI